MFLFPLRRVWLSWPFNYEFLQHGADEARSSDAGSVFRPACSNTHADLAEACQSGERCSTSRLEVKEKGWAACSELKGGDGVLGCCCCCWRPCRCCWTFCWHVFGCEPSARRRDTSGSPSQSEDEHAKLLPAGWKRNLRPIRDDLKWLSGWEGFTFTWFVCLTESRLVISSDGQQPVGWEVNLSHDWLNNHVIGLAHQSFSFSCVLSVG